jgi:RNA polymerase primary sigma factor
VVAAVAGDVGARRKLVDAFLPAIVGLALGFDSGTGVERQELIQEGVAGLLVAARRYDPRLNTPFWAYASFWVRKAMQELVAELARPVALSDRAVRALTEIRTARREHLQAHCTEPTNEELSRATGFTPAHVEHLQATERRPRGMEERLIADGEIAATVGDTITDPVAELAYERVLDNIEIREVLDLARSVGRAGAHGDPSALRARRVHADAGQDRRRPRPYRRARSTDRGWCTEQAARGTLANLRSERRLRRPPSVALGGDCARAGSSAVRREAPRSMPAAPNARVGAPGAGRGACAGRGRALRAGRSRAPGRQAAARSRIARGMAHDAAGHVHEAKLGRRFGDSVTFRVDGRMHPDCTDYWDGNWLVLPFLCEQVGGCAR